MPNPNTSNEPERKPACPCRPRAEAPARAPETATQCADREQADLRAVAALDDYLAARLRAFLKDCGCPCCSARARLRTLREDSYNRACESPADIHCASTDRRDHHPDTAAIRAIVVSCVVDCFAALHPRQRREWFRETIDARIAPIARESCPHPDLAAAREAFARAGRYADNSDKAIRAATEGFRKDTDAGPAGAD